MAAKFEIKKATNGQYHFNLKAPNGKVVLSSETYADKRSALRGLESVRKNASKDAAFESLVSTSGQPYFTLRANNREVIGHSEMYSTASARAKGIASVKTHAASAVIVDTDGK